VEAPKLYLFKSRQHRDAAALEEKPQMPEVAKKNIKVVLRLEQEALDHRSFGEHVADVVTSVASKSWFSALHLALIAGWIAANALGYLHLDPYPFNLLSSIIAVEAIFLTLLVLASQHRMARVAERRSHLNLQIDLLAEQEMTVMLRMLERLLQHFKLDPVETAPQSAELRKMTDFEALVDQLDRRLTPKDPS